MRPADTQNNLGNGLRTQVERSEGADAVRAIPDLHATVTRNLARAEEACGIFTRSWSCAARRLIMRFPLMVTLVGFETEMTAGLVKVN